MAVLRLDAADAEAGSGGKAKGGDAAGSGGATPRKKGGKKGKARG